MACHTIDVGDIHQTGRIGNADSTRSPIEIPGGKVHLLAVALIADRGGMDHGQDRPDLVSNGRMAIRTFDLVVGDMFLMHELGGVFGREDLRFAVTLDAFALRDVAIALDDVDMTAFALHPSGDILPVIKSPPLDIDIALGFHMARDAASDRTGDAVLLPLRTCSIVMADEAIGLMDGEMFSLDELGMAGGAAKLHPSSQLLEMFSMGERYILVNHVLLKVFDLMASFLQTGRIADLSMGFGRPFARKEVGEGDLSIHPFPFEVVEEARFIVAAGAGHVSVAGGPPGLHIEFHLMAEAAEGRAFGEPEKGKGEEDKEKGAKEKGSLDRPFVFDGSFLKPQVNLDPEPFNEVVKFFQILWIGKFFEFLENGSRESIEKSKGTPFHSIPPTPNWDRI